MSKYLLFFFFAILPSLTLAVTEKYRCTLRDNPATTIVIGWNQVSGNNPRVYYDITNHGNNSASYSFSHGVDRTSLAKNMNSQFARLTGLQPNTVYYFIIKDDNSTSPCFSFKTAPDVPTERLSFIAGGDSRNNPIPRINANKMVAKTRPTAVLFGGDMTEMDSAPQWQEWLDDWQHTIAADGRMTAVLTTRGNHEWTNESIYELFDTPHPDIYYATTFGGNLFRAYTLNTLIPVNGSQKLWLENDLASNYNVLWKTAQYHHPMRPHVSTKPERNDLVAHWAPLFERYHLDFAVECDAHTVKSTYPIRLSDEAGSEEGFIRDDKNGVVYIGEGCWGAPLRGNDDDKSWTRHSGSFNEVKWIFIDQEKIEIRTIKTDNADVVAALSDENRFEMPDNIDIWTPAPGEDVLVLSSYSKKNKVIVFPNPTDKQLSLKLHIMPNLYPIRIELWDYTGMHHWSGLTDDDNLDIDVSLFPAGFYLLRVIDNEKHTITVPVVITR